MTNKKLTRTTLDQTSIEPSPSNNEDVQHDWHGVVKRRSVFKNIGIAGAALSASVLLSSESNAQASCRSTAKLPKGNAALLRLAVAVELIEADPMQAKENERRLGLEQEIQAFEEWQRNTLLVAKDSRLVAHMGFNSNVHRASIVGLGCAGALSTLQRVTDFVRANPDRKALMLAVEICSACYYVDRTLETVIGNAICADGAAAFLLSGASGSNSAYPRIIDFETFIDSERIDEAGLQHKDGKLRIVLGEAIQHLAGRMFEKALQPLLQRHGLSRSQIRFWVVHPGGRKVIDRVQKHVGMTDAQLRFSRGVLRNYGNMSSPTVMFVLDEIVRSGEHRPGDWGVMIALGPGMAAELALLRW